LSRRKDYESPARRARRVLLIAKADANASSFTSCLFAPKNLRRWRRCVSPRVNRARHSTGPRRARARLAAAADRGGDKNWPRPVSSKPKRIGGDDGEPRLRLEHVRRRPDRAELANRLAERPRAVGRSQSRWAPISRSRCRGRRELATYECGWRTSLKNPRLARFLKTEEAFRGVGASTRR